MSDDPSNLLADLRAKLANRGKKLGDPSSNVITIPQYHMTIPYKEYFVFGLQSIPTPSQIGKGFFSFMNPFDPRNNREIQRDVDKEIKENNDFVYMRARVLTLLESIGVTGPPPMQFGAGGQVNLKMVPKLSEIVSQTARVAEQQAAMVEFMLILPTGGAPPPPSIANWTQSQRVTYVMTSGNDGYVAYLTSGGTPIALLNVILDAAIFEDFFPPGIDIPVHLPAGPAGPDEVKFLNGNPLIPTAPPTKIARQKILGRATNLRWVINLSFVETGLGSTVSDRNRSKFIGRLLNAVFSGPDNDSNKELILRLFIRLGIYIPTTAELKALSPPVSPTVFGGALARYLLSGSSGIGPNYSKALIDLLRKLVQELPDGPVKDGLLRDLGAIPATVLTPEEDPVRQFDLRGASQTLLDQERDTIVNALRQVGFSDLDARRHFSRLLTSLESIGNFDIMSEKEMISIFGKLITVIEEILKLPKLSVSFKKIAEATSESAVNRAIGNITRRVTDKLMRAFPGSKWAKKLATILVEWLMEGKNPFKQGGARGAGGDPGDPGGVGGGGRFAPPKKGRPPNLVPPKLDPPLPQPAPQVPTPPITDGSDDGVGTGLGGNSPEFSGIEMTTIPRNVPFQGKPGEVDLSESKSVVDANALNEATWKQIEKSFDTNVGGPRVIFEATDWLDFPSIDDDSIHPFQPIPWDAGAGFRGDVDQIARLLLNGRIEIRRVYREGGPDGGDEPFYDVVINQRRYRIRKKTLIWLLALLLGLIAAAVVGAIESAIRTIDGTGQPKGPIDPDAPVDPGDDPESTVPKAATVRNHKKIGAEAYILNAPDDDDIAHNEKLWNQFIKRQPRGGEIENLSRRLALSRFRDLEQPRESHDTRQAPTSRSAQRNLRNVLQFDDYLNDIQENVYNQWTPLIQSEREETQDQMNNSIYRDLAYNEQIRHPRRPLIKGQYQQRNDGISFAPFSYATGGLLNDGNHRNTGQLEAYPNIYGFPQNRRLDQSVYKASRP